jgi:hypothetical protein
MGYLPRVLFFNAFKLGAELRTKQRRKTKEAIFVVFNL